MPQPHPLQKAPTADQLIQGFRQGGTGNCTSIAIIKAALMAFGTRPIFASVREDASGDTVTMRDSQKGYFVSTAEMDAARKLSHFQGTDTALLDHANFLFAAMAKRAQVDANDGHQSMSFDQAAETLNDGEHWLEGPGWLGLDEFVINGPHRSLPLLGGAPGFLRKQPAGIGKSWGHTWFASLGVHDHWGRPGGAPWKLTGAIALDINRIASL